MISYRGDEAIDWFGFSRLWSQTVGYAKTTSRIDSWNRRKTLSEGLASAGLLFFDKGDDVCMSNESCDLLYGAAVAWKELTQYYYIFTYGYKKQLYTINLSFPPEKFPHLAGFQYLKDVSLPRFSPSKTLDMVLSGKIKHSQIEKGSQYEESVKPRLEALIRLKETIEQEFLLHSYMPRFYSFVTKIKADYLISSAEVPIDFIFLIKSNSPGDISICDFVCCSAFTQTNRDYLENQLQRTILKKERIHIPTNISTILFDRLNK